MIIEHIQVRLMDLPHHVRGFTRKNKDGSYTILINARMTAQMQCDTYDHELRHINAGDFDREESVTILEKKRHG